MAQAAAEPATGKKSTLKLVLLSGLAVLVLIGATVASVWFFLGNASADPARQTAPVKREPLFIPLDQFTVNLADEGGERLAQIGVTLEVADDRTDKAIRLLMPSIRNSVLLLLSSKTSAELLTIPGKEALAAEIALRTGAALGWDSAAAGTAGAPPNPVHAVHFSQFIIQ